MLFNKKKYSKLTLFELFSDDILQYTLESLSYASSDRGSRVVESIKLKSIPNSILTERLFQILFTEKFPLGDYIYEVVGNRLERYNPNVRVEKQDKKPFTVSKPFTVHTDIDKDPGVVVSVR